MNIVEKPKSESHSLALPAFSMKFSTAWMKSDDWPGNPSNDLIWLEPVQ